MQDLIKQEQFELELLDRLNSKKMLSSLVLGGGTMLRLCFGLERFSVDLDFWVVKKINYNKLYTDLTSFLSGPYIIKDRANKFHTFLFELKSKDYPRSLKIEIRKEPKKIKIETAIAYSRYSNLQVFLQAVSLEDMMREKVATFLKRKEVRDVFDIEFLFKRGMSLDFSADVLKKLLREIDSLSKRDYAVKLGSLLEEKHRKYYSSQNFKILKSAILERLNSS